MWGQLRVLKLRKTCWLYWICVEWTLMIRGAVISIGGSTRKVALSADLGVQAERGCVVLRNAFPFFLAFSQRKASPHFAQRTGATVVIGSAIQIAGNNFARGRDGRLCGCSSDGKHAMCCDGSRSPSCGCD
jgi:hypothetical protein